MKLKSEDLYQVLPGLASVSSNTFAQDVLEGLAGERKSLPARWFYDKRGSALFELISELPEYYPTRCEAEILQQYRGWIAGLMNGRLRLVELGAGDGRKTKILLRHFRDKGLKFESVPVDICEASVCGLASSISKEFPELKVSGLVAEYFEALQWLGEQDDLPTLVLFLGSNIGNFEKGGDQLFLDWLRAALKPQDKALVGFDLIKMKPFSFPPIKTH